MWKKNKKISRLNRPSDLPTSEFTEDFRLFIKQCYRIAWSAAKILKVKIKNL